MQTFLPFENYAESAACLDRQRLGKQRVEVLQILQALSNPNSTSNWRNHPAVLMWKGYEWQLGIYGVCICDEWKSRGYKDNCLPQIRELSIEFTPSHKKPEWLNEEFCRAHQSNLLRKFPEHYKQFFPADVPNNLPYIWPKGG